jgi:hypothetical protein
MKKLGHVNMPVNPKVILSLTIGAVHILPDFLFFFYCGKKFNGIALSGTLDEIFYLGRFNLMERGLGVLAGHGVFEHIHDTWSVMSPYKEMMLSILGKLFGLNNWQNDILLTFLMPIFVFWAIYYLTLELSSSTKASVASGVTILFGYNLFCLDNFLSNITNSCLLFMRPVSPQLPHLILLISLFLAYQCVKSANLWKSIVTGALSGILIYVNIFYWIFFISGFATFSILTFLLDKDSTCPVKEIFWAIAISIAITVPFWNHYLYISQIPAYQDIKLRYNIGNAANQMTFVFPITQVGLFGFILFFLRKDFMKPRSLFLFSFPMAGFLFLNQHLVTGVKLSEIYIRNYLTKTFLLISFIVVAFDILGIFEKKYQWFNKNFKKLVFLYVAFLLSMGIFIQYNYFNTHSKQFLAYQKWGEIFSWLNKNTSQDSVILTDSLDKFPTADFLLAYTQNYVFLPVDLSAFITNDEYLRRHLLSAKFFMHPEKDILSSLQLCRNIYGIATLANYGGSIDCKNENIKSAKVYKKLTVNDLFKYKVDYIINDNPLLKNQILNSYPFVKIVYEANNIQIFKIMLS